MGGLRATANHRPSNDMPNPQAFIENWDFRAVLGVKLDRASGKIVSSIVNPGYTPPATPFGFSLGKFDISGGAASYHPGEMDPNSGVVGGGGLHPYSSFTPEDIGDLARAKATLLASAFLKFRAGPTTDEMGRLVGSPRHVPWVWSEFIIARTATNRLVLHGRGSSFPTHSFYANGVRVGDLKQDAMNFQGPTPALEIGKEMKAASSQSALPAPDSPVPGNICSPSHTYTLSANPDMVSDNLP